MSQHTSPTAQVLYEASAIKREMNSRRAQRESERKVRALANRIEQAKFSARVGECVAALLGDIGVGDERREDEIRGLNSTLRDLDAQRCTEDAELYK